MNYSSNIGVKEEELDWKLFVHISHIVHTMSWAYKALQGVNEAQNFISNFSGLVMTFSTWLFVQQYLRMVVSL